MRRPPNFAKKERTFMSRIILRFSIVVGIFLSLAGLAWAQSYDIQIASAGGKTYLADSNGMTLYYYTKDVDGSSACYGGCAKAWPIFSAPNPSVGPGLSTSDFGTITRTDGTSQTTYKGWPLYYWAKDAKAGDMTGEGVGGVWYIVDVPASTVMIGTSSTLGNYLTDGTGKTLYWFTKDTPGVSNCSGGCISAWPVFNPQSVVVPSALSASDFGTITRADGTQQTTYKGYPLYYWAKDAKRGDTTGQNVGGVWFVIDPKKFPPAK
jgi:predicted lipoprotein with Yx(FWY)xxD motif